MHYSSNGESCQEEELCKMREEMFKRPDKPSLEGFEDVLKNIIDVIDDTYGESYRANNEYGEKDFELYEKGVQLAKDAVTNYCRLRIQEINSPFTYRPRTVQIEKTLGDENEKVYLMSRCYKCGKMAKWYFDKTLINKCSECGYEFIGNVGKDW